MRESHTPKMRTSRKSKMVRRSMSNPRSPKTRNTPTVTNEVWRQAGFYVKLTPCPAMPHMELRLSGVTRSLQPFSLVSSVVRHGKGSEGNLNRQVNCYASNAGTGCNSRKGRLADSQCYRRGSESVVVGGVTTTQGERESRSQGKGTQIQPVSLHSDTDGQAAVSRRNP